jgi:hypothetical protein
MPNNQELLEALQERMNVVRQFVDSLEDNGVNVDHLRDTIDDVYNELGELEDIHG